MNTFERAAALTDIPSGTMQCVTIRGREVLIANADGEVLATDDTCTHEDASLSCGVLDGTIVRCPLHGATFDLRDGSPRDEPAEEPLRCHEIRVEDGVVFVRLRGE
ncbi:MAG: non-heme iron oxygenase ferredoxin subunit [Thiotrichales bacterium]|nr:non-heme iron oxygenase ferredoxin subunit [Thiotrichales bacterium]MCY4350803.1 non-heme iron oxygenase ferredoxin subunit [Thiotrichales bacterium]